MILGIGCDLIEISRFKAAMERQGDKFLARLFCAAEISYCSSFQNPELHFAARFCAKESIAKALGCGIGQKFSWHDVEICNDSNGKPVVKWHINVKELFGVSSCHLSMSHSHTAAMSFVVLEG
jgi:holo-[acyl-carrier protein] synthase